MTSPSTLSLQASRVPARLNLDSLVVCSLVLISMWLEVPRQLAPTTISVGAFFTVLAGGLVWLMWLARPVGSRTILHRMWPFGVLALHGATSTLWYPVSKYGFQQLLVLGAFIGTFALSTRAFRNPGKLEYLSLAISVSAAGSTLAYYVTSYTQGLGAEGWFSPRSFAIVALVQFAWFASRARHGQRRFAFGSVAVLGAIFLSLSRTALCAALLAVPASMLNRISPRRVLRIGGYTVLVVVLLAGAIVYFRPLNERFFVGDVSLSVGGVGVNVMGRLTVWSVLLAAFPDAPAFGHGVGSSRDLIEEYYSGSIIHPHNDYIRVLYEYGVIGLGFLLWGIGNLVYGAWRQWQCADRSQSAHSWLHCAAFLLLLIYCILMMTDNLMVYIAFQVPFAAVLGASCGLRPAAGTGCSDEAKHALGDPQLGF